MYRYKNQGYFHMKNLAFLLLICVISAFAMPVSAAALPGPSADIDFAAVDSYITAQMGKHGLQGISLAIIQGDQTVYQKGYGSAGGGTAMTPQTPMYIGSQSKSITALAIAQLAEQGKVDLNAPVRAYIPWFTVADASASEKITVSNLLHQTSGLQRVQVAQHRPGLNLERVRYLLGAIGMQGQQADHPQPVYVHQCLKELPDFIIDHGLIGLPCFRSTVEQGHQMGQQMQT